MESASKMLALFSCPKEVSITPYLSKDQIAAAREMDLLTYLRRFEPEELVHIGGDTYATRTHDSLKISSGGCFLFGCRAAYPWGTAPCADQIRANRTAPEN